MVLKTNVLIQVLSAVVGGTAAFFLSQLAVGIDPPSTEPSMTPPPAPRPSIATQPLPEKPAAVLNQLRVSNRSTYPIRVVLLSRQSTPEEERFHWDFAPAEGNKEGLVLSRPTGQLQLQAGDVLTAFALDGSRRYWGPYIVGTTKLPTQETPTSEWQLILTP